MNRMFSIAITTHPQPMVIIDGGQFGSHRSLDGGETWEEIGCIGSGVAGMSMFVDQDSRRFYVAAYTNLFMSVDGGKTCRPANGLLGRVRTIALAYSGSGKQTILYASTTGGDLGGSDLVGSMQVSDIQDNDLVKAGIYRYVQHIRQTYLPLARR